MPDRRWGSRFRGRPWTSFRWTIQLLALAAFFLLFLATRNRPSSLVNLALRLDPLIALSHLLASRTVLAGSALALLTVVVTLVVGRAWCGWVCPLGTLLDLFPLRRRREKAEAPSEAWRRAKYGLLLLILSAALLTNLSLLALDPMTILVRALTVTVWPTLDLMVTSMEHALYQVAVLRGAVSALDGILRPTLLSSAPILYRAPLIYGVLLASVILMNLAAERFWCRYLCPLGGLLGMLSKVAPVRRRVGTQCKECDLCTRACPTGTIRPEKGYDSDPGECTVCMQCVEACPRGGNSFGLSRSVAAWHEYDPTRRQVLETLGIAVLGVGVLRFDRGSAQGHPHLIRPPGSAENNLLSKCVRCGECIRACPTGALQPSILEEGLEGFWSPIVIPRLGYCEYGCNACGQVCPVEAIPPLSLEAKRRRLMGIAFIDRNRCIPWSEGGDCIVCEEMCPVPEKAIALEEVEERQGGATEHRVLRPHMVKDLCIGCGICEYKCPVAGEAAIRVYAPRASQEPTT